MVIFLAIGSLLLWDRRHLLHAAMPGIKISVCPNDGTDTLYQNNYSCVDIIFAISPVITVSGQNPITGVTEVHPEESG